MGKVYQRLCAKILNSVHSTVENTNESDMSCQTNTDTLRLPFCTCADVVSDIEELKLSQEINREIIQALSQSVEQIAEAIGQGKSDKTGKIRPNKHNNTAPKFMQKSSCEKNNTKSNGSNRNANVPNEVIEVSEAVHSITLNDGNDETDNPSIPDKRVERISLQDKRPSTTQLDNSSKHITRTSKHLIPCPFLRKKGHCLKGSRCDFSHEFDSRQSSQLRQQHSLPYNFFTSCDAIPIPTPVFQFLQLSVHSIAHGHSDSAPQILMTVYEKQEPHDCNNSKIPVRITPRMNETDYVRKTQSYYPNKIKKKHSSMLSTNLITIKPLKNGAPAPKLIPKSQNKEIVPEGYLGSVPLMFVSSRMSPRASWPPSSWPVDFSMTIGRN